jgi:hypothetical protein
MSNIEIIVNPIWSKIPNHLSNTFLNDTLFKLSKRGNKIIKYKSNVSPINFKGYFLTGILEDLIEDIEKNRL